jgi:hypothetical protein
MGDTAIILFGLVGTSILAWTTWRLLRRKRTHWAWKLVSALAFPLALAWGWLAFAMVVKETGMWPDLSGVAVLRLVELTRVFGWIPFIAFLIWGPRTESLKPDQT